MFVLQVAQHAPKHITQYASDTQRPTSAGAALPMDDTHEPPVFSTALQPEFLTSDELEDGGWSSGFDDSDDDIIGGTF